MKGKMKMREISEQFAHKLRNGTLFELYQKHRDELFLGVRDDCINLYYNGLSVCEASLNDKGDFSCKISSKYLGRDGSNRLLTVSDNCICDNYEKIKMIMKNDTAVKKKNGHSRHS
jgi:hypothetical protein